eukprot:scaffold2418_cov58-Cyclotella_meneghiniana.AAC.14
MSTSKDKSFPHKLYTLLESPSSDCMSSSAAITWLSHGRAFIILDQHAFITVIVPKYFKQTKLRSFTRQLNLWGFIRIRDGWDRGGWYHPHFLRGRPSELALITRTAIKKKNAANDAPSSANQVNRLKTPNFYEMPAIVPDPIEEIPITSSNAGRSDDQNTNRSIKKLSIVNVAAQTNPDDMRATRRASGNECASIVQTLPRCSSAPTESRHLSYLANSLEALPHSMPSRIDVIQARHEQALGRESFPALPFSTSEQNLNFRRYLMNQSNYQEYNDMSGTIQQPWHVPQSGSEYNSFQNSIPQTSMMLQARGLCHYGAEFQLLHAEQSSAHPNQDQYRMGSEYVDSTTLNPNQQTHQITQMSPFVLGHTTSQTSYQDGTSTYQESSSIPPAEAQLSTPKSILDTLLINLGCPNAMLPNGNEVGTTSLTTGFGRNDNNSVCNSTNIFGHVQRDECLLSEGNCTSPTTLTHQVPAPPLQAILQLYRCLLSQNYCTQPTTLMHQVHASPQQVSLTESEKGGHGENSNINLPQDDIEFRQLIDGLPCFEQDEDEQFD